MLCSGCESWFSHDKVEKRMVLLYIAATESSFSPFAEGNITDMLEGYVPQKNSKDQELLVFFQNRDASSPTLRGQGKLSRYYSKSGKILEEIIATYDEDFDACTAENFAKVLATAEATCSPTYRSLLFSSHGTGWMPAGYFDGEGESSYILSRNKDDLPVETRMTIRESIGYDAHTKNEIDIRDFAAALGKYHWEAALLDCCYMGTIEVAYELRNCCDWVLASPTEILITGFPYPVILDQLFNNPGKKGLEYIGQKYYELYQGQSGQLQSGTIGLVNCSELEPLSEICAAIVRDNRTAQKGVVRNDVQHYFYRSNKDFFFDFAHYFEQFTPADQFTEFSRQIDKTIPYKSTTEKFIGVAMEHFSGVSCYIPSPKYPKLNTYYSQLAWNQKVKIIE